ncbi:hypothetical protein ACQY0O_005919 [Thecaphora frezii]
MYRAMLLQDEKALLPGAPQRNEEPLRRKRGFRCLSALMMSLGFGLWLAANSRSSPRPFAAKHSSILEAVPSCPIQPPALAPSVVWRPETNSSWLVESAERLGAAIRVPTATYDGMALDPTQDDRFEVLLAFHDYLRKTFPLFHASAKLTKVNTYGLLYELPGSDPSLKPALFTGHQDVVPVPQDTEARWSHPPFGGVFDPKTGLVWGRGASDDKNMLVSIFEALEQLQREGFKNRRTLLLASGFDEEVGGKRGAAYLGQELRARYGTDDPLEFILDEGGLGVGTTQNGRLDVALPAVGEKGYADVRISVTAEGGHSSVPPDHTAIGILSRILVQLESQPFRPSLSPRNPILIHLICLADALDEQERLGIAEATGSGGDEGFVLDRPLREQLRNPNRWDQAAQRISREGTRAERYVIQTSQAVDVIVGGAKANALPESTSAIVNHRIAVDSNVQEIRDRLQMLVGRVADELDLELVAFGNATAANASRSSSAGQVELELMQSSDPTPISSAKSAQFGRLASTIRHVFPGRGGRERLVTPVIMTGNTDTRWYLDLSSNIWRFNPNTHMMNSGKHAIDERMDIYAHAQTTRFIHALIRNTDEPLR